MTELTTFFLKLNETTRKITQNDIKTSLTLEKLTCAKFPNFDTSKSEFNIIQRQLTPNFNKIPINDLSLIKNGDLIEITHAKLNSPVKITHHNNPHTINQNLDHLNNEKLLCVIHNLPKNITFDELRAFLNINTPNNQITLIHDLNGIKTGECFIELNTENELKNAIEKNEEIIQNNQINHKITVERAKRSDFERLFRLKQISKVILMRNVPFDAEEADIRIFFHSIPINEIHFAPFNSRIDRVKDVFVEVTTQNHLKKILQRNRKYIFDCSIQLYESSHEQLNASNARKITHDSLLDKEFDCLHMRGLPFRTGEEEIIAFFKKANVKPCVIHRKADGSEAFCEFESVSECLKAMTLDRKYIKNRYVELFRISSEEIFKIIGKTRKRSRSFSPKRISRHKRHMKQHKFINENPQKPFLNDLNRKQSPKSNSDIYRPDLDSKDDTKQDKISIEPKIPISNTPSFDKMAPLHPIQNLSSVPSEYQSPVIPMQPQNTNLNTFQSSESFQTPYSVYNQPIYPIYNIEHIQEHVPYPIIPQQQPQQGDQSSQMYHLYSQTQQNAFAQPQMVNYPVQLEQQAPQFQPQSVNLVGEQVNEVNMSQQQSGGVFSSQGSGFNGVVNDFGRFN